MNCTRAPRTRRTRTGLLSDSDSNTCGRFGCRDAILVGAPLVPLRLRIVCATDGGELRCGGRKLHSELAELPRRRAVRFGVHRASAEQCARLQQQRRALLLPFVLVPRRALPFTPDFAASAAPTRRDAMPRRGFALFSVVLNRCDEAAWVTGRGARARCSGVVLAGTLLLISGVRRPHHEPSVRHLSTNPWSRVRARRPRAPRRHHERLHGVRASRASRAMGGRRSPR